MTTKNDNYWLPESKPAAPPGYASHHRLEPPPLHAQHPGTSGSRFTAQAPTPIAIPNNAGREYSRYYPAGSVPVASTNLVRPVNQNVYRDDGVRNDTTTMYPNVNVAVTGLSQDSYAYTDPREADKALKDLMDGTMNDSDEGKNVEVTDDDARVPGFKEGIHLLPHQVIGRRWMDERENDTKKRNFGGILADDMGLGKTIQTLTRIVEGKRTNSDKEAGWAKTTLVVCPLALIGQWAEEIEQVTKGLVVVKHHGGSRTTNPGDLQKADVVITTYDILKSEYAVFNPPEPDETKSSKDTTRKTVTQDEDELDSSDDEYHRQGRKAKGRARDALFRVKWLRVVLDEAHAIKNRNTNAAIACFELESKYRWALTGTPMQNDVAELFSLLKFLHKRPFDDWEYFHKAVARPVKTGRGANNAMKRLQVVLKGIMLRRRKDDKVNGKALVELPKRIINVVSCPFSKLERQFYVGLENRMGQALEQLNEEAVRAGKTQASYMSVLVLLLRLRQACNHPILVSQDYKADLDAVESKGARVSDPDGVNPDALADALGQLGVTRRCQVCTAELTSANSTDKVDGQCDDCATLTSQARGQTSTQSDSGKIRTILALLKRIDTKSTWQEKTIIFSQFTSMLNLLEPCLKDAGYTFVRYDGSMKPHEREEALRTIKTDPEVRIILISFKAGSTGLNLTCCNNVILVDLWWNPALEDQAFDRCHRFGQRKDVKIYKLKVDKTVEDRILELQDKKRELARAALSGDQVKNLRLGMADLLALFRPSSLAALAFASYASARISISGPSNPVAGAQTDIAWVSSPGDAENFTLFLLDFDGLPFSLRQNFGELNTAEGKATITFNADLST
ncbi:hypothetical protein PQX77_021090 [Marasmius sp. AFHP31]|nr:hypothetical protein PQX77_021090 [Marasmius sp. AFHP31]